MPRLRIDHVWTLTAAAQPAPGAKRASRWVVTAVWCFAALVYVPMTITPLVMALVQPDEEFWVKVIAGFVNGAIATLLFFVGGPARKVR